MKIDNKKISEIIKEIMESAEIMDITSKFENLKNEIKNGITDYCRRADPLDISNKLDIPVDEVIEYLEIIQKNWEIKEAMLMLINIDKPFKEEIERLALKYIGESHRDLL